VHTRSTPILQVLQTSDYYPFGLQIAAGSYQKQTALDNDYLYNGKELQDEHNLGWMDYGARMYMPEIGRWGVVDPLAFKYFSHSPYNYALNNPIYFIDPDGAEVSPSELAKKALEAKKIDTNVVTIGYNKQTKTTTMGYSTVRYRAGSSEKEVNIIVGSTYIEMDGEGNITHQSTTLTEYNVTQTDEQKESGDFSISENSIFSPNDFEAKDAIENANSAHSELVGTFGSFIKKGGDVENAFGFNTKDFTIGDVFEKGLQVFDFIFLKKVPAPLTVDLEKRMGKVNPIVWGKVSSKDENELIEKLKNN